MSTRFTRGLARSDSEILLDEFLHGLGFWRKMIPKDGNCLFRIAAEKLFGSQIFHGVVKDMFESYSYFQKNSKGSESTCQFHFLSLLMKKDFKIFWNSSPDMKICTSNNFEEKIILCTVDEKHFDLVYSLDYVGVSALCQSILYEVLYENVFGVNNALDKSKDMMGVKTPTSPKFIPSPFNHYNADCLSHNDFPYSRTFIAFPYKVAKSLSVDILRNVEYDAWLEVKKARTYGCSQYPHFDNVPIPGDKCQVILEGHESPFNAHIQEIQKDRGLVIVFVEGLGEKHAVPINTIKLLAMPSQLDCCWRKRIKKKTCDGNKNFVIPSIQARHSLRSSRIHSPGNCMIKPQDGFQAMKPIVEDYDNIEMYMKDKSYSGGHLRKDFDDCNEEQDGLYDFSPEDDEVLVDDGGAASTTWNYVENQVRTGSAEGCPMSPEGATTEGVTSQMVQYMPSVYTPSTYMVVPAPNGHILNYENYPGSINFSASPSADVNGTDLPSQDISTSRFFYNLGVLTYNGWIMAQNQVGQQSINSPSPLICNTSGIYMTSQTPTVVSPEFVVVTNNDSYTSGYMAGINNGTFYYSATTPASPYIQMATTMQYHSAV